MNRDLAIASIFSVIATVVLPSCSVPSISVLERSDVSEKAQQFTVQIDGEESGTGVIIERNGNNYTVITCWHVVDTPGKYTVQTIDDLQHDIVYSQIKNQSGIDLAVLQFTSDRDYPVAKIGNSEKINFGKDLYITGYPDAFPGVPERSYFFINTSVVSKLPKAEKGYEILLDTGSTPGSSGGAIVDSKGRLIGINGKSISEGNTNRVFGGAIPIQIYMTAKDGLQVPKNVEPPQDLLSRGQRKLKAGNYKSAIAFYNQVLEQEPNNIDALSNRAKAYYWLNNFESAIKDLDTVLQFNPANTSFLFYRGNVYGELKEYDKAIADYTEAIRLDPKHAKTYHNRGVVHNYQEEYQKAIADYNEAIRLDPEDVLTYYNRGNSYSNLGKYGKSNDDYTEAIIRLDSKNDLASFAYNNRANNYSDLGEYDKALADYNRAININPNNVNTYNGRGNIYSYQKNYQQALVDFNKAIELNPSYAEAYCNRGNNYKIQGKYKEAIADYNEVIRLNPEVAEAYYNRGNSYKSLEESNKAIEDFQQAANLFQQQGNTENYQTTLNIIKELQ